MATGAAAKRILSKAIDLMDLGDQPGHLLRRAQQRAVELFSAAVGDNGLTPPQFAALLTVYRHPGLTQRQLVERTGIDRSTVADMIERLTTRGLMLRRRVTRDQRANSLSISAAGIAALDGAIEAVEAAQRRIMDPVPPQKRAMAIEILALLADVQRSSDRPTRARRFSLPQRRDE